MSMPNNTLNHFLQRIQKDFPDLHVVASQKSYWDPSNGTIYYNRDAKNPLWSILHELGHMQAKHTSFRLDVELLIMETEAWKIAKNLALIYRIPLDKEHIDNCLDSYRDWLYARSMCPGCTQTGVQDNQKLYNCLNCRRSWSVSTSRFSRSYRKLATAAH